MKNIIFDWSGVISDDFIPAYKASMLVMDSLIGKTITKEEFRREFTLPAVNFWRKYIPDLTEKENEKRHELFSNNIHKVEKPKPYKNTKEVLEKLDSKGIKMIVISSHPHEKLILEAKEYGFTDYFREINGSIHDKVDEIKEILQRNNFDPKQTIYIGDMTHDIDAGKEAGVTTVALTSGYQDKNRLEKHNPDHIISNITELLNLI